MVTSKQSAFGPTLPNIPPLTLQQISFHSSLTCMNSYVHDHPSYPPVPSLHIHQTHTIPPSICSPSSYPPITPHTHPTCYHHHSLHHSFPTSFFPFFPMCMQPVCMATFRYPIFQAHNCLEIFVNGEKDLYVKNVQRIVTLMEKR